VAGAAPVGAASSPSVLPRPRRKRTITSTSRTAPRAIRTQPHHGTPPPELEVADVVCTVALTFAEADRVMDTFDGGLLAAWLLVTVLAPPEPAAGEL
jgi:hypothetical protein